MKIVIDTCVLVKAFSRKNNYFTILEQIQKGNIEIAISNDILLEYIEVLQDFFGDRIIKILEDFFLESPSVFLVDPHYNFFLIKNDHDDNKFVDTAICGNVDFLITLDKHFQDAKLSKFPKLNIISPEEFISKYL